MCEDCKESAPQFVAYFNKAGGKLWRPAQKAPTAWAIDIQAPGPRPSFVCDGSGVSATAAADTDERAAPQSAQRAEVG